MAVTGFTPTAAIPGLMPAGTSLANANPLLAGSPVSGPVAAAQAGVVEQPSLTQRLMGAMKAAIGELRGTTAAPVALPASQTLAMSSPVHASTAPTAVRRAKSAKKVRTAKTWKTLANPPKAAAAATAAPQVTQPMSALPSNATVLPGGTVYTYGANGQPIPAGLAGLSPQMQQQLGLSPQMIAGFDQLAGQADPDGPQMNATNQNSLGSTGYGTAVPVLGAPIATTPVAEATGTPGTTDQTVTNRNTNDTSTCVNGLGYGTWGAPYGGIATPYSPYGASMNGVAASGIGGFFSRLLG